MKKAIIYFKGKFIVDVKYERIESTDVATFLVSGFGDDKKVVAKIPISHLIIFE